MSDKDDVEDSCDSIPPSKKSRRSASANLFGDTNSSSMTVDRSGDEFVSILLLDN